MVVSYFFRFIVYINIKKTIMNQNEKLLENIKKFDLARETPVDRFARIMYEVAGEGQKETVKEIINILKPKQNGKRK